MRIKKFDILLLKTYIGPLILTFLIAIFVLLMQFLWKYVDDLVGKGLDIWTLSKLMFYASTTFVPMALPLAILLSSLMTFGNLGEHYELVAIKSVGQSLRKIMTPLIWFSVFTALIAFYFSNNILPFVNLKMYSLLHDVRNAKPALNIREGFFYYDIDNYVIKVGEKGNDGRSLKNIVIYNHKNFQGNTSITIAESGYMEMSEDKRFLIIYLYNGYSYNELLKNREHHSTRPLERMHFKEQYKKFDLSSFSMQKTDESFFKEHYQMMNLHQLNSAIDSIDQYIDSNHVRLSRHVIQHYHNFSNINKTGQITNDSLSETLLHPFINNFSDYDDKIFIVNNAFKSAQNLKEICGYREMEIHQLNKHKIRHKVEQHRKFTLSIACIILFFIGAPLGAIIRKGGLGLPLVVATLVFVLYYILSVTGEKFVREDVWNPWFGMWFSSIVLLPFGTWLTYVATTDNPIMDVEWYEKLSSKVFGFFRKKCM